MFRYEKEYAPNAIAFEISANPFHGTSEPPRVISALPKHTMQTLRKFTVMSVVRVFRSAKGYTVAIGYYSPEGRLVVPISSELMKNGERVYAGTMTYGDEEHDRIAFGFPTRIDVAKYLQNPKPFWKRTSLLNTTNIVNLHYDRNKWVRQDTFAGTSSPKTRFLTYLTMAQDIMLAPIDQKMPFRMPGQS